MISDGETVILLGGTTVKFICPYLRSKKALKVITNSVLIMNELLAEEEAEVVLLGGVLDRKELLTTGYLTSLCIKSCTQKSFFRSRAIHSHYG